tara:strand:+ start:351 stop:701 length:351 start_codon:yes stop_codon:yes gene_type:complete
MDTGNVPPPHPQPQPGAPQYAQQPAADSGVSSIIPYKNVPALVGYYMACFGLLAMIIPFLGALYGIAVLVLGIFGMKKASANPEAKGKVHAIIAIPGGLLETGVGIFVTIMVLSNM